MASELNDTAKSDTRKEIDSKLIQYFNEALSAENAAVDRIKSRIEECPIPEAKQKLQHHLEETINQQNRLRSIIEKRGGSPTDSKAHLPELSPPTTMMMSKAAKDTMKSLTGDADNPLQDEMELTRMKNDAIIEHGEIVAYTALIQLAKKAGAQDAITSLEQNLNEEKEMASWFMNNTPSMVDQIWPKIEAAITAGKNR
ncbi:MAG: ferritin-like domain-containing protein [Thermoproteota archaeon]|nr:ferritin-like domain-containing protein [Thermoproteota archaeon]